MPANIEPFVGFRSFEENDQKIFFGRIREISDLLSLVIAHPVVLLYAQSGAGKTSLLNAGLIPCLKEEELEVLAVARVQGLIPKVVKLETVSNPYVFNSLMSWSGKKESTRNPIEFQKMSLKEFLEERPRLKDEEGNLLPRVLIFDQFEELFSSYPERWADRRDFLAEIGELLSNDSSLRVLFAMREDYIAQLDPYVSLLPENLRARLRLGCLRRHAAQEAIKGPLTITGLSSEDATAVADKLVDRLLMSRIETVPGKIEEVPGEVVEPVQLQVVCQRLWHKYRDSGLREIPDVPPDVDEVLLDYYEESIKMVVNNNGIPQTKTSEEKVSEETLREWFGEKLITKLGTRGVVFREPNETAGIPNWVIDYLSDKRHIIRGEWRAGARWYELGHDRFIRPIQESNLTWYQRNPLIMLAREWDQEHRAPNKLLEGQRLQDALADDGHSLDTLVDEFLTASLKAQQAKEQLQQQVQQQRELQHQRDLTEEQTKRANERTEAAKKLKRRAIALAVATTIAIVALAAALVLLGVAMQEEARAVQAEQDARALWVRALANDAVDVISEKPQLSLLLATEALRRSPRDKQDHLVVADAVASFQEVLSKTGSVPLCSQKHINVTNTTIIKPSFDKAWLAAGGQDGQVHLWQIDTDSTETNTCESAFSSLQVHNGPVTTIAFSSDNRWLVSGGEDGIIGVLDLKNQNNGFSKITLGQSSAPVLALAFHPTEPWLIVSTAQNSVQRINVAESSNPKPVKYLLNSDKPIATLAFSPHGRWLATVDISDTLRLWQITPAIPLNDSRLLSKGKNGIIAFSPPNGRWLVAARKGEQLVSLFDTSQQNPTPISLDGHREGVQAVSFSPDGAKLAVGSGDGTVRLWDMLAFDKGVETPGANVPTPPPRTPMENTKITRIPDVSATITNEKPAVVAPEAKLIPAHNSTVLALAYTSNPTNQRRWLVTTGADHTVKVWLEQDIQTPKYALYGHDGSTTSVVFGSQPTLLFTRGSDGTVRVWNLSKPRSPSFAGSPTWSELQEWMAEACHRAGRNLSPNEQTLYLQGVQGAMSCDQYQYLKY